MKLYLYDADELFVILHERLVFFGDGFVLCRESGNEFLRKRLDDGRLT